MRAVYMGAALLIIGAVGLYLAAAPREFPGVAMPVPPRPASWGMIAVGSIGMLHTIGGLGGSLLATSVLGATWILCVLLGPVRPRLAMTIAGSSVVGLMLGAAL
ncbi:MAG: hypothetical protein AAGL66_01070 [Pseudomonadota bacterium]